MTDKLHWRADLMAGAVVAVLLIPQSLAYAMLAGLPPQVGLYASLLPLLAYAALGSSPVLGLGPVAVLALMIAQALAGLPAGVSAEQGALVLAAEVGAFLALAALLRLDALASLLSVPALRGFENGATLMIAAGQLPVLLGSTAAGFTLPPLTTVRQVMPARLRSRVDALQVTAVPRGGVAVDTETLLALGGAIRAREEVRFDYASDHGGGEAADAPVRVAQPHHLLARSGRWYLLAWDPERADWRTFRADRIAPRLPTGPRFTPREPPEDAASHVVRGTSSLAWEHPARVRREHAEHDPHRGRLARAVAAHEAEQLAGVQREAHVLQRHGVAVALADRLDVELVVHGGHLRDAGSGAGSRPRPLPASAGRARGGRLPG